MAVYTVIAHTGNRLSAGTNSRIYIKIRGTQEESDDENLNCFKRLWQGSKQECKVHTNACLGDLVLVTLYGKHFMGLYNQWFCDQISIETPEGDQILFPCYQWIGCREKVVLTPAKATLAFIDCHPIAYKHRICHLQDHRETFRWRLYAEDTPQVIDCDTPFDLPAEIQFSFTKTTEFLAGAGKQLAALNLLGLADSAKSWESLWHLDMVLCEGRSQVIEYVKDHWDEDEFFGYQFLNGLNPMMIRRCLELPANFPVTDDMVKHSLQGCSLELEMKRGNIFLSDYKMLDGLVGNVIHCEQQYLTAPIVLLYCNPQGLLMPIAIQLGQFPGTRNPIFLPTDSKTDWQMAKIYVRNAEFAVHEVDSHLLRTHILAEVFTISTLRNLPPPHPLYKILYPHIRYTLQINIMARTQLISDTGSITMHAGIGGESVPKILQRATAALTYSSLCLPDNIMERGLEDIPNYYYRDDGMKLWNIIHKFVEQNVTHFYKCDANVQQDPELQVWIKEIFTKGCLEGQSTGIPSSFHTLKDLVKFVTMVIFTVSAQHASVNNGQFDFGGWMPNYPATLRKPPPKEKGQTTEDTLLETLPDVGTTVNGIAVLRLLSTKSTDHYPLGCFPEQLFDEEIPCRLIEDFQKDLKDLSQTIEKRNKTLELPYVYLSPENVDNSVAI